MKYLSFILCTLLSLQAFASTCETNYRIVDECYETRGRLQASKEKPSVRMWKVGTKRVLGVVNENLENLPKIVKEEFSFGVYVFADYLVCPLTIDKPGRMQMVCVESIKNIRIEDYRENPDVPVITRIQDVSAKTNIQDVPVVIINQNETEQTHAVGPLLLMIVIFAVAIMLFFFLRTKRKSRRITQPMGYEDGYQNPVESYSQNITILSEKQKNVETAIKKKSHSETALKDQLENFPEVKVEHIIDGDTVIVVKDWRKIKIRLDSIDCPECDQYWGDTAKFGLIKLIGGQNVRLEEHGKDLHERTLATIYVQHRYGSEWMNVNERMVTLGHAWVTRRFYNHLPKDRQTKLNRLERWARSKKVGLWQKPNPTAPWKWRREE